MRAVDTSVIVRFLTGDDPRQFRQASSFIQSEEIWVSKTVLLETEWVLRKLDRFKSTEVLGALRALTGLTNVLVEDPAAIGRALAWAEAGVDFADALHMASRGISRNFVTFDADLVKRAKRAGETATLLE